MAIGFSTHLRLQRDWVSVADTGKPLSPSDILETQANLRILWSLFFADSVSTPTLGGKSRLPWDVSRAPSFLSTIPPDSADIPSIAFEYHCRLLQLQQKFIDPIYSTDFPSLPLAEKESLYLKAYDALTSLRRDIDPRLYSSRATPPHKTQLVFWISYHAAELHLNRRFLDPDNQTPKHVSALRAITAAAGSITRLVKTLDVNGELQGTPSFLVYHIIRAGLVHGVNMTAADDRTRRIATNGFRICLRALRRLVATWPDLAPDCVSFLERTAEAWGFEVEKDLSDPRQAGVQTDDSTDWDAISNLEANFFITLG